MLGNKTLSVKIVLMASILALSSTLPAVKASTGSCCGVGCCTTDGCCSIAGSCTFSHSCNGNSCPCLGEELVKFNLGYDRKASAKSSGAAHATFVLNKDADISAAAAAVKKASGGNAVVKKDAVGGEGGEQRDVYERAGTAGPGSHSGPAVADALEKRSDGCVGASCEGTSGGKGGNGAIGHGH